MIEVRHKNRPKIFNPTNDEFWATMAFGGIVALVFIGFIGGIILDAVWIKGPGTDEPNTPEGLDFFILIGWPVVTLWVTYPLLVFGSKRIWPSTYVSSHAQEEAVRQFRDLHKDVQEQVRPAYDAFMQLRGDDPQYDEARKLYSRAVGAANYQQKLLAQQYIDLTSVKNSIEDIESSNNHLKEMIARD